MLIQERHNLAEKSWQVVSLLDTPDKTTVVVDKENTEVEIVPSDVPAVVVKEENLPAVVAEEKEEEHAVLVVEEEAARSFSSGEALRASSSSSSSNSNNSPAPVMASSMSYLAPFVASVLRDQVLVDLLAESKRKDERIQQQEEDRLRLEVTGQSGKPKYYKASMRDGQMTPTGNGFYVFFNRPLLPNFVDKIPRLEVRLGGVNVAPFYQMLVVTSTAERAGFDRTRDNAPQLGRIKFFSNRNDGVQVFGCVGPILPSDYANLPHTMAVADLVQFVKHYQTINGPYMMCYLKILSIFVPKCQINGINFLDTPDKGTTTKNVWGEEKREVEAAEVVPVPIAVVDEVVPLVVVEEEHAVPSDEEEGEEEEGEEEEEVVSAVVDKVVPAVVVDEENTVAPSFEEIRRGMGFSPINSNPNDPVPHDEDLMGWHSPEAPRPINRRSIYDPIQID